MDSPVLTLYVLGLTGLLNNLRNLLWINVQQYTVREVGVALVAHLHAWVQCGAILIITRLIFTQILPKDTP